MDERQLVVHKFEQLCNENHDTLLMDSYKSVDYVTVETLLKFDAINKTLKPSLIPLKNDLIKNIRYISLDEFICLLDRTILDFSLQKLERIILFLDRYISLFDVLILSYMWKYIKSKVVLMTYNFDDIVNYLSTQDPLLPEKPKVGILSITESVYTFEKMSLYLSRIDMQKISKFNVLVYYITLFMNKDIWASIDVKHSNFLLYVPNGNLVNMLKCDSSINALFCRYGYIPLYTFYAVNHINIVIKELQLDKETNTSYLIEYKNNNRLEDMNLPHPFKEYIQLYPGTKNLKENEVDFTYNDGVYIPLLDLLLFSHKYPQLEYETNSKRLIDFQIKFNLFMNRNPHTKTFHHHAVNIQTFRQNVTDS